MPTLNIKIVSDFICPWCYVGKVRILRILKEQFSELDYSIEYIPYQLYPNIPIEGKPLDSFKKNKTEGLGKKLHQEASTEGIEFNFGNIKMIPNTLLAHYAMSKLQNEEEKSLASSAIFKAHFTEGKDISDATVLKDLLSSTLDKNISIQYVTQDLTDVQRVIEEQKETYSIYQVPSYKINNAGVLPGVLPEAMFKKWLSKMSR